MLQMALQLKDNVPRSIQGIRGWTWEREEGEEMGVREGQVESGERMRHTSATHRFLQGCLRNDLLRHWSR